MHQVRVSVAGEVSDERLLTVPFEVLAPSGQLLAKGMASPTHSPLVSLPHFADDLPHVHVIARLPDGQELQQVAMLGEAPSEVAFAVGNRSPHEWLQWVTPFHSLEHLKQGSSSSRQIGRVWMALWTFQGGQWSAVDAGPIAQMRDHGTRQMTLDVPEGPHLLQVGGDMVAWRLVALPPKCRVRVALTRSASAHGDAVDITVSRTQPMNELIMSYLSRGNQADAARLGDAWQAAELMLWRKMDDPVSAAAGAYLLLKIRRLRERRQWVDNLVRWFPDLADGPIVAAALALQSDGADEQLVRDMALLAVNRGLPVFALGASILVETMAAVHRGEDESLRFREAFVLAQAYRRAICSRGAYFAFYGRSPDKPSWVRTYGPADQPSSQPSLEGPPASSPRIDPVPQQARNLSATRSAGAWARQLSQTHFSLRRTEMPPELFGEDPAAAGGAEPWDEQLQRTAFTVFDGSE